MKKWIAWMLALIMLLALVGCGSSKHNSPNFDEMLDTDTNTVYALGDPKEKFDEAFGESEYNSNNSYIYLDGLLIMQFADDDTVYSIMCSGETNRFSFAEFSFDQDIESIEKNYIKDMSSSGATIYSKYYNEKGKEFDSHSYVTTRLTVEDGNYVSYWICYADKIFNAS